jgi:hypothetical protein
VEGYSEDVAGRRIPCKECDRPFVVTNVLVVGSVADEKSRSRPILGSPARVSRVPYLVAIGGLLVGNALLARSWLSARGEAEALAAEAGVLRRAIEEADSVVRAPPPKGSEDGAETEEADPPEGETQEAETREEVDGRETIEGVKLAFALQSGVIKDLKDKVSELERRVAAGEKLLRIEKNARRDTAKRAEKLRKENVLLRRENDQLSRRLR